MLCIDEEKKTWPWNDRFCRHMCFWPHHGPHTRIYRLCLAFFSLFSCGLLTHLWLFASVLSKVLAQCGPSIEYMTCLARTLQRAAAAAMKMIFSAFFRDSFTAKKGRISVAFCGWTRNLWHIIKGNNISGHGSSAPPPLSSEKSPNFTDTPMIRSKTERTHTVHQGATNSCSCCLLSTTVCVPLPSEPAEESESVYTGFESFQTWPETLEVSKARPDIICRLLVGPQEDWLDSQLSLSRF